ncbi:MAG: DUF2254 family protein [Nocardioidaceae bacterium]
MPGLAVVVAVALVLTCIGTLVWYVNHIGQALRVAALVGLGRQRHGADTGPCVSRPRCSGLTSDPMSSSHQRPESCSPSTTIGSSCWLGEQTAAWSCCGRVGDFVPTGSALFRVVGDPARLSSKDVVASVAIGPERTLNQDVAYGIRMLVDIAQRSLASGPFADPTTAVQAIDRLHDILRQIVRRPLHSGEYHDATGALRLLVPTMRWEGTCGSRSTRSVRSAPARRRCHDVSRLHWTI